MRFIAILRSLDSKHEHYVVEEVFEAQFAFADDYLTLNLNLRLPIVLFWSQGSRMVDSLEEEGGRHYKFWNTFLKNVCSDPTSAIKINYTIRDHKCHGSLSKWPISCRWLVNSLLRKEEWPAECSLFSLTAWVKYSSFSGCVINGFLASLRGRIYWG